MAKIYKKQPLDIVVSGITLRYSMKYDIWVNWAGTRAYRKYNNQSWNRFLQIHTIRLPIAEPLFRLSTSQGYRPLS